MPTNSSCQSVILVIKNVFITLLINFVLSNIAIAEKAVMVDPLSYKQKLQYTKSSAEGDDEAITNPQVFVNPEENITEDDNTIIGKISERLSPLSLEEKISNQTVQNSLEQFGYDLFDKVPTTFAPVTNIPVPPDYILGPGDTIIVQLYGNTNVQYKLVVSREGNILIPELGPVAVSGMTFSETKAIITIKFEKQLFGTKAAITMGEIRTINIMAVGDVVNPGSYTVAGLTNLMNGLLVSGGVKKTGSLRRIQLKRNGKVVTNFDLYKVLLEGDASENHKLEHGDVIFVPPIGSTVGIGGEVQRPAIYELKGKTSFNDLINLAGGLLPTASIKASHIERITKQDYYTIIDLNNQESKFDDVILKSGDLIRILPVKKIIDDVVILSGHVMRPGGYAFKENMKLSDIISSTKQLQQNADINFALLKREKRDQRRIIVKYIELLKAIQNPESKFNILLEPRDEIIFFDSSSNRPNFLTGVTQSIKSQSGSEYPVMLFSMYGFLNSPGLFPLEYGARLLDVFDMAGGVLPGTDRSYIVIARKTYPSKKLIIFSTDLDKAEQDPSSEWNPVIHPEDTIYVFDNKMNRSALLGNSLAVLEKQAKYSELSPIVSLSGKIANKGDFPLEPGMRIEDLIKAAGGLSESTYGITAELTRFEFIEGERQVIEHRYIELDKIMENRHDYNLRLRPHDHLTIHQKPQWQKNKFVDVIGEVNFPGQYPIASDETLCSLIDRAGGLTDNAYSFGAIFTRKRIQNQQIKALEEMQNKLNELYSKLIVTEAGENDYSAYPPEPKIQGTNFLSLKLKKPIGRMVINLDRGKECDNKTNFILEEGDSLSVPKVHNEVTVMGEVYFPATHIFQQDKTMLDYVRLSGGHTELAKKSHIYVVQANGEVFSLREETWGKKIEIKPGAKIYIPLDLDRRSTNELLQSWTEIFYNLALTAGGLATVFK